MLRRRKLMAMQTGGLPGEYRKVEWIESTGTQYIETTAVLGANDFTIDFEFAQTMKTSAEQPIVSIWTSAYGYWNTFIHNGLRTLDIYTSGHHYAKDNAITLDTKHTASLTRSGANWTLTLDGEQTTWAFSPSGVNNTTVKVLARGDLNANSTPYIRLYSMKLSISGGKAFDLIPCIRKSDDKPGMYDTVSKTFYTNTGSGEFIIPA